MPTDYVGYKIKPPTCRKKFRWSQDRGGCRFAPGHKGDCKPKKRGSR